jgi:thymidylate kinase
MLITVSGIVGSGKSTLAREIADIAGGRGITAHPLRFQALPCFRWLSSRRPPSATASDSPKREQTERWSNYRRRRLTGRAALVYLARVLAFRVYRLSWKTRDLYICNRYFFDSFAHFEISSWSERAWLRLLTRCIPEPDIAILATAGPAAITLRRPQYSAAYIDQVGKAYATVRAWFPMLIELRTDLDDTPSKPALESLLSTLL